MTRIVRAAIHLYQSWSGTRPPTCRFAPTCSHYTDDAIEEYGLVRGSWLGVKRICRCHPWGGHGLDPIPARKAN